MKIIRNALSLEKQNEIERAFLSDDFCWYYNTVTAYKSIESKHDFFTIDTPQFTHTFVMNGTSNSNYSWIIKPFMDVFDISIDKILRAKCNLLTCRENYPHDHYQTPHIDFYDHGKRTLSLLYYVNHSDGDTFFFNSDGLISERVTPEKGKAIVFDSNYFHAASPPRKYENRLVINLLYQTEAVK